jgi:hypothetical protein
MENLIREMLRDPSPLLAGLPIQWETIPQERQQTVVVMSLHCVLNGPVGVNKTTRFPTVAQAMAIKDIINTSNSSWKAFCKEVARVVKSIQPEIDCSSRRKNGDYWPLAEWIQ